MELNYIWHRTISWRNTLYLIWTWSSHERKKMLQRFFNFFCWCHCVARFSYFLAYIGTVWPKNGGQSIQIQMQYTSLSKLCIIEKTLMVSLNFALSICNLFSDDGEYFKKKLRVVWPNFNIFFEKYKYLAQLRLVCAFKKKTRG